KRWWSLGYPRSLYNSRRHAVGVFHVGNLHGHRCRRNGRCVAAAILGHSSCGHCWSRHSKSAWLHFCDLPDGRIPARPGVSICGTRLGHRLTTTSKCQRLLTLLFLSMYGKSWLHRLSIAMIEEREPYVCISCSARRARHRSL